MNLITQIIVNIRPVIFRYIAFCHDCCRNADTGVGSGIQIRSDSVVFNITEDPLFTPDCFSLDIEVQQDLLFKGRSHFQCQLVFAGTDLDIKTDLQLGIRSILGISVAQMAQPTADVRFYLHSLYGNTVTRHQLQITPGCRRTILSCKCQVLQSHICGKCLQFLCCQSHSCQIFRCLHCKTAINGILFYFLFNGSGSILVQFKLHLFCTIYCHGIQYFVLRNIFISKDRIIPGHCDCCDLSISKCRSCFKASTVECQIIAHIYRGISIQSHFLIHTSRVVEFFCIDRHGSVTAIFIICNVYRKYVRCKQHIPCVSHAIVVGIPFYFRNSDISRISIILLC